MRKEGLVVSKLNFHNLCTTGQWSLNQSKKGLASHYLARWKNSWIDGTQLDAFNIPEQQAIDMALSGMNYFLPMYTNLISTFLARRQIETSTDMPLEKCLTYTALEDTFIDLDTKITSKQKSFDNINYASTNTNITCHYCGKQGHIERDCRKKKRDQQGNSNQRKNYISQQNHHQTRHYGNNNNNNRIFFWVASISAFIVTIIGEAVWVGNCTCRSCGPCYQPLGMHLPGRIIAHW